MKKLLKRIVTMAMAATMVAGLSSVAMAGEKVGEKTIYVQIDSSFANYAGTDNVAINTWNAGADLSIGGTVANSSAGLFSGWDTKPFDMTKVSDGIYKIPVVAYDDGNDDSGAFIVVYENGASSDKGQFKVEKSSAVSDAIKNANSTVITLVAKIVDDATVEGGKRYTLEVKDGVDPTAKTDDKKTEETKTDDKKADTTATEAPKADAQGTDASPKTGDMAPIATAAVLGVVSLAGVAIALRKKAA